MLGQSLRGQMNSDRFKNLYSQMDLLKRRITIIIIERDLWLMNVHLVVCDHIRCKDPLPLNKYLREIAVVLDSICLLGRMYKCCLDVIIVLEGLACQGYILYTILSKTIRLWNVFKNCSQTY